MAVQKKKKKNPSLKNIRLLLDEFLKNKHTKRDTKTTLEKIHKFVPETREVSDPGLLQTQDLFYLVQYSAMVCDFETMGFLFSCLVRPFHYFPP